MKARKKRKKGNKLQYWLVAKVAFGLLGMLRMLPALKAISFTERMARWIGPRTGRHRLVVSNLRHAFPEKSAADIADLAVNSWGQLGRMAAEYVFFRKLYDFDPARPDTGRVTLKDDHGIVADLKAHPRPFIFITAHTANFELLPHVAAAVGLPIAVLFRPPNNPYVAQEINRFRDGGAGWLVPSYGGSSMVLARHLADKGGLGILVDQKFRRGIESHFFGQPVSTNPLVPRLARQFDCEVIPARCVRLEGGRFVIEVEPPLDLARDEAGQIDAALAAQAINDKVEAWVRQYPEQWLWYHDRWYRKGSLKAGLDD